MRPPAAVDSSRGWGVVAAAFAGMFVTFGIAYSFGAFLAPMAEEFGSGGAAGGNFDMTPHQGASTLGARTWTSTRSSAKRRAGPSC